MSNRETSMTSDEIMFADGLRLRSYQQDAYDAFKDKTKDIFILEFCRRGGKDILTTRFLAILASQKVGMYYYAFPTNKDAHRIFFQDRLCDYIPRQLILENPKLQGRFKVEDPIAINFKNGSIILIVGADTTKGHNLVGVNCCGIAFSEFALYKNAEKVYSVAFPTLLKTRGKMIINSTPRAGSYFSELCIKAATSPNIYYSKITGERGLSKAEMEMARLAMSESMFQREIMCNEHIGEETAVYGKYLNKVTTQYIYINPKLPIYASMDLGITANTVIWWCQIDGGTVNMIGYHESCDRMFIDYVRMLLTFIGEKYYYGGVFVPHDSLNRDANLITKHQSLHAFPELRVQLLNRKSFEGSLETTKCFFEKHNIVFSPECQQGLIRLRQYEYVSKNISIPVSKGKASDCADSLKYMAVGINDFVRSFSRVHNWHKD